MTFVSHALSPSPPNKCVGNDFCMYHFSFRERGEQVANYSPVTKITVLGYTHHFQSTAEISTSLKLP